MAILSLYDVRVHCQEADVLDKGVVTCVDL